MSKSKPNDIPEVVAVDATSGRAWRFRPDRLARMKVKLDQAAQAPNDLSEPS